MHVLCHLVATTNTLLFTELQAKYVFYLLCSFPVVLYTILLLPSLPFSPPPSLLSPSSLPSLPPLSPSLPPLSPSLPPLSPSLPPLSPSLPPLSPYLPPSSLFLCTEVSVSIAMTKSTTSNLVLYRACGMHN